jgi:excisionase family DNA binding protein
MDELKVYTLIEAQEILKVTRRSLYNFIKAGKLKALKIGREWRITHSDLSAFIGTRQ